MNPFFTCVTLAHLAVEVEEGADDLTDTNEEETGEGRRNHESVQRGHYMVLNLHTQLGCVQKGILEVVPGAEHQDVRLTHQAILGQTYSTRQEGFTSVTC